MLAVRRGEIEVLKVSGWEVAEDGPVVIWKPRLFLPLTDFFSYCLPTLGMN